jgi:hypothetical protein
MPAAVRAASNCLGKLSGVTLPVCFRTGSSHSRRFGWRRASRQTPLPRSRIPSCESMAPQVPNLVPGCARKRQNAQSGCHGTASHDRGCEKVLAHDQNLEEERAILLHRSCEMLNQICRALASPAPHLLGQRVRHQKIVADNLSKAGWSWGCVLSRGLWRAIYLRC